jgi:hypothetical protein
MLSGDLYIPENAENEKLPALAISGPFGAVKDSLLDMPIKWRKEVLLLLLLTLLYR